MVYEQNEWMNEWMKWFKVGKPEPFLSLSLRKILNPAQL